MINDFTLTRNYYIELNLVSILYQDLKHKPWFLKTVFLLLAIALSGCATKQQFLRVDAVPQEGQIIEDDNGNDVVVSNKQIKVSISPMYKIDQLSRRSIFYVLIENTSEIEIKTDLASISSSYSDMASEYPLEVVSYETLLEEINGSAAVLEENERLRAFYAGLRSKEAGVDLREELKPATSATINYGSYDGSRVNAFEPFRKYRYSSKDNSWYGTAQDRQVVTASERKNIRETLEKTLANIELIKIQEREALEKAYFRSLSIPAGYRYQGVLPLETRHLTSQGTGTITIDIPLADELHRFVFERSQISSVDPWIDQ